MAAAMLSRPVYPGLVPDMHAKHNLIVTEGEGAEAVLGLAKKTSAEFFARTTILYCPAGSAGADHEAALAKLNPKHFWVLPSLPTVMFRLKGVLATADMGTRLYAAGTEPFIGSVIQEALTAGIDFKSVLTEHRGSAKRRVQCVHCKGMTENVTTNPVVCSHCGINLFVRDHYSRRLGAFQGVIIDAEEPGSAPPPEEIYR